PAERPPDREDLGARLVLGAETVLGAHAAAPEHQAIVERIDALPPWREEHVVDDAADEVHTLTADGHRKEELLQQELGQVVPEVLAIPDSGPVPNELSHDSLPTDLRAGHNCPPGRGVLTRRGVNRSRRRAHQPWIEPEDPVAATGPARVVPGAERDAAPGDVAACVERHNRQPVVVGRLELRGPLSLGARAR